MEKIQRSHWERRLSQSQCCSDRLSSSCHGCLESNICPAIKGHNLEGQQAENNIQRAILLGVFILSSSRPSKICDFLLCRAAPLLCWIPHRHCPSPDRFQGIRGEVGSDPPTPHLIPASNTSGSRSTV